MIKSLIPILLLGACTSEKSTFGPSDPGSGSVSVKLDKTSFKTGEPITGIVSWKDAPRRSAVALSLNLSVPNGTGFQVRKVGIWSASIGGDGSLPFRWSGNGFSCYSSSELPETCSAKATPGPQTISAQVYDPALVEHPFNSHPIGYKPKDPKLFSGTSSPFKIVFDTAAEPDFSGIKNALFWRVRRSIDTHTVGLFNQPGAGRPSDIKVRVERESYCFDVPVETPYRSPVVFCFPKKDLVTSAGMVDRPAALQDESLLEIPLTGGAMNRAKAEERAMAVAEKPYLDRVAYRWQPGQRQETIEGVKRRYSTQSLDLRRDPKTSTTYLGDSIGGHTYRKDLAGWIIIVNEIMAGGTVRDDRRFSDVVMVYVPDDGRAACVIESRPSSGRWQSDPISVQPKCT